MNGLFRLARHAAFCAFDPAHMGRSYAQRERFNQSVFVAPDRSFLFTKNEKCGNNTARITLQNLVSKTPLPPGFSDTNRWFAPLLMPSDLGLKHIAEIDDAARFRFAIVRNPFSRILSCYLNKFDSKKGRREALEKSLEAEGEDIGFAEFVDRVGRQTPEQMNPHWRVQYNNIYCDIIGYDRFVHFENMEEELAEILSRYAKRPSIVSVRKGQFRAGEKIAQYYTEEIAQAVRRIYAIDFETFGYSQNLPE